LHGRYLWREFISNGRVAGKLDARNRLRGSQIEVGKSSLQIQEGFSTSACDTAEIAKVIPNARIVAWNSEKRQLPSARPAMVLVESSSISDD